jgi:hypothetical protein
MQRETRENTIGFVKNYLNPEVNSLTTYGAGGCSGVEGRGAGEDWVLYSPRGRRIVSKESCTILKVDGATVLKNPLPRRETTGPPAKRATLEPPLDAASDTPPSPEVNI